MYRGALDLVISNYGGYSSDDEVPIGRVSTKRCINESDEDSSCPRRKRLPVPEIIASSTNSEEGPIDDPAVHGGRQRCFPHERGNWVTYVFIPYEPPDGTISDITTQIINKLSHLTLHPIDHFHISLTKTVILKHHWIDAFIQSVREKTSLIKKFMIVFNSLNVYCNEERTRTFIGIDIRSGHDTLMKLVSYLDSCLDEFRLSHFYKNPSYHMSLLWCVGDRESEIRKELPYLHCCVEQILRNYPQNNWYNYVTHLQCKSGNKLFHFDLM